MSGLGLRRRDVEEEKWRRRSGGGGKRNKKKEKKMNEKKLSNSHRVLFCSLQPSVPFARARKRAHI